MAFTKKGQVEVTFNWMYVMIAGAVILLFFVGIVVKEKLFAQEELGQDLVRVMESILTGAGVSEKTKNIIDISGLADYTLYFDCEEGVTKYGLKGTSARTEDATQAVFAPHEIKGTKLIAWSLPYLFPYKVTDLLFVTSTNTKYFLYSEKGNGKDIFVNEFMKATDGFTREYTVSKEAYNTIDPESNFHVRIVDIGGTVIKKGEKVPAKLQAMENERVTGVVFTGNEHSVYVEYYRKNGNAWEKDITSLIPIPVLSLGGERDAAKYAALFAADGAAYRCGMKQAFKRLKYVAEVYQGKATQAIEYYQQHPELQFTKNCIGYYNGDISPNVMNALASQSANVQGCVADPTMKICTQLVDAATQVKEANMNLVSQGDCIPLY